MKKLIGIIAILTIILYMGVQNNQVLFAKQDGKPLIVMYGDFKCPYCKK